MPYKEPPLAHQFKPGQSGNPAGRPKGLPNTKTRLIRLLSLVEKIKNPVTGVVEGFTILEQLDLRQIERARKGDLKSYKEIIDRLEGRAAQTVDLTSQGRELRPMAFFDLNPDPELKPKKRKPKVVKRKVAVGKRTPGRSNPKAKRTTSSSKKPKV